jgi:hypothetical protein
MGRTGHWVRWVRKPSVSKIGKLGIEGLDIDESMEAPQGDYDMAEDSFVALAGSGFDSSAPFDMNVDDRQLFPALVSSEQGVTVKIPNGAWAAKLEKKLVPEEETTHLMPEGPAEDQHLEVEEKAGTPEDWILLSLADVNDAFDAVVEKQTSKAKPEQDAPSMDWSVAGMPSALLRKIIRGSANAAHRSMHSAQNVIPVPLHVVRAQNSGSSKRQRSTPKSPRSQSNSRSMR